MKVELFPKAEADIIRQFRYYLVEQDAPSTAVRFREAVIGSIKQLKSRVRPAVLILNQKYNFRPNWSWRAA